MEKENYTATIDVAQSAKEVFNAICNVTHWWSKDFQGNSNKQDDEFVINHPGQHYSKQKLVEVIPDKKIVWLITESELNWLKGNTEEWTNTRMIFEIDSSDNKTTLHFTHDGLIPEKECYAMCAKGWDIVIKDWLLHRITFGEPSDGMSKAAEIRNKSLENNAKNYHRTIAVNASPQDAMKKICQIDRWWKHDVAGSTEKINDTFCVPFGDLNGENSFVDFVVSEFVADKKIVWKVTDCNLPWFKDKKEWNNTEVVFEIASEKDKTKIDFTHIGLVPGIECYDACEKGWDGHVTKSLLSFMNEGMGNPQ
ncbi:SRPBCC family protein [Cytophaga aurantiaca]|uniref:SRPBCC family protein n=1 Tax=Cytophaga aurantiaca TaxID=29530 RepID=UPI00037D0254|nr:SRPBCC domain-containing protein [Cytophaga aurantiaca]